VLAAGAWVALTVTSGTAWAVLITDSPNLPPLQGQYVSPAQWHAYYGMGIDIKDVIHHGFTASIPPPPPPGGTATHSFGSDVDVLVSMDGGTTYSPMKAPADVKVSITFAKQDGNTDYFVTEMLQLDLEGGTLPLGAMIRESPTRASTGEATVTTLDDGRHQIISFFDIFTELSLDSGTTWYASDVPAHMELVPIIPEPSQVLVPLLILLGMGVNVVPRHFSRKTC
jgi:hypothetical protein